MQVQKIQKETKESNWLSKMVILKLWWSYLKKYSQVSIKIAISLHYLFQKMFPPCFSLFHPAYVKRINQNMPLAWLGYEISKDRTDSLKRSRLTDYPKFTYLFSITTFPKRFSTYRQIKYFHLTEIPTRKLSLIIFVTNHIWIFLCP